MSLSDLASLGSFVSGLAVLASLAFLYFQMRQMTEQVKQSERNQRALMNQGITNRVNDMMVWIAEPHMADLLSRFEAGETDFTRAEVRQLHSYLHALLNSARDTFNQHRAGLADQGMFEAASTALGLIFSQRCYRALWTGQASTPELRAYVDDIIRRTPLSEPVDVVARFKAAFIEATH